jgi:hypothetical protein
MTTKGPNVKMYRLFGWFTLIENTIAKYGIDTSDICPFERHKPPAGPSPHMP